MFFTEKCNMADDLSRSGIAAAVVFGMLGLIMGIID
jgi:hypothetical protein